MDGASGSGSHTVTVQSATADQIAADLATLAYVPAAGTSSDVGVVIIAVPPAQVTTTRAIPIAITTGGGPTLTEPASATISANSKVAVGGSYADSFAQSNPGSLFLAIHDSTGTLDATDAAGNAYLDPAPTALRCRRIMSTSMPSWLACAMPLARPPARTRLHSTSGTRPAWKQLLPHR